MAINLNDNIAVLGAKPTDARYLNNLTPYADVNAVNTAIAANKRYTGLTVNVGGVEYWYKDGILDGNLVQKESNIATVGLTGATNGLCKVGQDVILGGTLTGNTEITGAGKTLFLGTETTPLNWLGTWADTNSMISATDLLLDIDAGTCALTLCSGDFVFSLDNQQCFARFTDDRTGTTATGIQYAGAYRANFTDLSLVDKCYVDLCAGTSGVQSANNGLTKDGTNVRLGGNLTGNTTIGLDSGNLCFVSGTATSQFGSLGTILNFNGSCLYLTNSGNDFLLKSRCGTCFQFGTDGIHYGGDYSANYTARSLVDAGFVTGITSLIGGTVTSVAALTLGTTGTDLSSSVADSTTTPVITLNVPTASATNRGALSSTDWSTFNAKTTCIGTITGGTNGLGESGTNVCLGGTLSAPTTISGTELLTLGALNGICLKTANACNIIIDGQSNGGVVMKSQSGTVGGNDFTDAIGILADFNGSFLVYDNRATPHGICYDDDYSAGYDDRSLVDKGYVDSVATGLEAHAAVEAATSPSDGNISLSGVAGTIDGIPISGITGATNRILVKDQTDGTENGIYAAASGAWTRTSDYDFAPTGEVANGDLIPVLSGSSQASSVWILVTKNPITSGVTSLEFSQFSQQLAITGGDGVDITTVSGSQQISVELSSSTPGLCFDGGRLELDYVSLVGSGLSENAGAIDVNACGTATGNELGIDINAGDCLVLGSAQITQDNLVAAGGNLGGYGSQICLKYNDSNELIVDPADLPEVTANNGLSAAGNNVTLGGALTGGTYVNLDGNDLCICDVSSHGVRIDGGYGFWKASNGIEFTVDGTSCLNLGTNTFCDLTGTGEGLKYDSNADYSSTFVDNSLVSKCYVDTLVSNSGLTAGLGLTNNAGTLDINITDEAATGNELNIAIGTYGNNVLYLDSYCVTRDNLVAANGATIGGNAINLSYDGSNQLAIDSQLITQDSLVAAGGDGGYATLITLKYNGTCELGLDPADVAGAITFENGLDSTTNAGTVCLGGNLTDSTIIDTQGTYGLSIETGGVGLVVCPAGGVVLGDAAKVSGFLSTDDANMWAAACISIVTDCTNASIDSGVHMIAGIGEVATLDAINGGTLSLGSYAGNIFTDNTGNGYGIQYAADYCGTFQDASLVSKCYVDGVVAASAVTFTNGLTNTSGAVCLGGTLTELTTAIATDNNALTIYDTNSFGLCIGSCTATLGDPSNNVAYITVEDAGTTVYDCASVQVISDTTLSISSPDITISGATTICSELTLSTVNSGSVSTDDVMVIDSSGVVKKISAATLGEDNNNYITSGITSATTLDDTYFAVLADSTGGAFTITLPLAPTTGQAYKIKDAGLDALTNNITISGNGNDIDGNTTAVINTDGGALEIVYDGTAWFALSFVN